MNRRLTNRRLPLALALAGLLFGACDDDDDPKASTDAGVADAANVDAMSVQTAFDQAVAAIGGEGALTSLERVQIEATGNRSFDFEAEVPGDAMEVSSYVRSYRIDLANNNVRINTQRTPLFEALQFGPVANFSIILNGNLGGLSAQAGFVPPGNLPSDYIGALRTQLRLFNPQFYLLDGLADPSLIGDGGSATVEGRPHRIITFAGEVAEIRLFVDDETGTISKLETMENSVLVRDTAIELRYTNWSPGTVSFAQRVELYAAGTLLADESRTAITIDPAFAATEFDLPPEAINPQFDASAFEFGQQTHQVIEAFFNLAFTYAERPPITPSELAPNVTLLSGGANSIVVNYGQGVVLIEAATTPAFGSDLVDQIATLYPATQITHVVQSHHHQDHASGVRSIVAAGATAVVGNGVMAHWQNVLSAPSTIRPDALSLATGITPKIEEISQDGSFMVSAANATVTAYHISANPHSEDMVITSVDIPGQRFVYVADLYNAGFGGTLVLGGPESFFANLRNLGILDASCGSAVPLTIVPAHGIPLTLNAAIAELGNLGVDVGCPAL